MARKGKSAAADIRKYALSDPEMRKFAEERYLNGYLDACTASEQRVALHEKLPLPRSIYAYLLDPNNERHPHQIGQNVGRTFGWRILCKDVEKPEWDDSIDPRQWTSTSQFWNVRDPVAKNSFFEGMQKGWQAATERMDAKLDEDEVKRLDDFQTVEPRARTKPEARTAETVRQTDSKQRSGGGDEQPTDKACFYCKKTGHLVRDCRKKAKSRQKHAQVGSNSVLDRGSARDHQGNGDVKSQANAPQQRELAMPDRAKAKSPDRQVRRSENESVQTSRKTTHRSWSSLSSDSSIFIPQSPRRERIADVDYDHSSPRFTVEAEEQSEDHRSYASLHSAPWRSSRPQRGLHDSAFAPEEYCPSSVSRYYGSSRGHSISHTFADYLEERERERASSGSHW